MKKHQEFECFMFLHSKGDFKRFIEGERVVFEKYHAKHSRKLAGCALAQWWCLGAGDVTLSLTAIGGEQGC